MHGNVTRSGSSCWGGLRASDLSFLALIFSIGGNGNQNSPLMEGCIVNVTRMAHDLLQSTRESRLGTISANCDMGHSAPVFLVEPYLVLGS